MKNYHKYLEAACSVLSTNPEFNVPDTVGYNAAKMLVDEFRSGFSSSFNGEVLGIPINLLDCDQGVVLVKDLFVIHEIALLIKIQELNKSSKFKNFFDFGANIGLYSIFASNLNLNVKSFEPDPITYDLFQANISENNINNGNLQTFNSAIWSSETELEFTRVVENRTASGITKSGKNFYGETNTFSVQCVNVNDVIKSDSIIKIDVEGSELEIFNAILWEDISNVVLFIELGSEEVRTGIFNTCQEKGLDLHSQMVGWEIANNSSELPLSWRDGSIMVVKK
ncbi:MAG: FkbM family methyltransferase [Amylibacter sp.]|jgi:FkbM family methyltransferase